jgi:hypothetical protein
MCLRDFVLFLDGIRITFINDSIYYYLSGLLLLTTVFIIIYLGL